MEPSISDSRKALDDKSTMQKLCQIIGVQYNHFKDIKGKNSEKEVNISSDIYDFRNLYFFRKKRILSCLGDDDFNMKLSNELILLIFKWLPKKDLVTCTKVCKKWYEIAQTEVLWSRLDLFRKTLHEDTLWHILSRGVKALRIAQAKIITFNSQQSEENIIDDDICKLQYLDASIAMITPDKLATLLSKCRYLKNLSLENCTVNEACCKAISNCTDLSVLNLAMCEGVNLRCVLHILKLKSLTQLNLAWTSLDTICVRLLCKSLPRSINRLNISGCTETITDDDIIDLVQSCPSLVELDLSDCVLLTGSSLCTISKLSELQHLVLNRCYRINASAYTILTSMPCLTHLDVFGLQAELVLERIQVNKFMFSSIARPTVGKTRGTIWGLRVNN